MNTEPMVELIAEVVERSMSETIRRLESKSRNRSVCRRTSRISEAALNTQSLPPALLLKWRSFYDTASLRYSSIN
ncbi:MAG: hypothetical protein AABN34_18360 [Acidobacteriota bacterium]